MNDDPGPNLEKEFLEEWKNVAKVICASSGCVMFILGSLFLLDFIL
jgi:hypothetical protein